MAGRVLLTQLLLCCLIAGGYAITQGTVSTIRGKIRKMIQQDPIDEGLAPRNYRMLAGLLRLAFHDCVGKRCDGCINMRTEDNAGLDIYINKTEVLYQTLKKNGKPILSRADFWALAGIEAVRMAANTRLCRRCKKVVVPLKFKTGRKDCVGKPKGSPWTTDVHKFPSPVGTTKETTDFFKKQFGFGAMQTVAIMGAHTLGQAHRFASGFANPWVTDRNKFDNEYYKVLIDPARNWTNVRFGPPRRPKWQWESRTQAPIMMLNCDMALYKNLTKVSNFGQVKGCKYNSCKLVDKSSANTAYWVKKYAKDNSLFLENFGKAFTKMIRHGYDKLNDVDPSSTDTLVG